MKNEFITAISALAAEKNLPRDVVFEAVEVALASAYKKDNLAQSNVVVKINAEDGTMKVYTQKDVVDEVEDDKIQMTVDEARRYKPDANVGDVLNFEATP
ncbi:MAG TPA: NusA N-terminal domain-containing protein, partial [Dehalococcoidia bacterium]|nr:NusA N-terminal domain-containing protein [Dehalococcoidia bacterium]